MIKITCERDGEKIEISYPDGSVDCDQQPIEIHIFKTILYWMTYAEDTIAKMIPDCENCDIDS